MNPAAPTKSICLLGCGVATGYGAAINTAKVTKGKSRLSFVAKTRKSINDRNISCFVGHW